ncbi:DNA/RNA non-specific endonuclease [Cupriavidus sp. AU9028]|uniref:DNA/RNA non-specific endonuclease n=1 Tax=Cupriavidus sp. AU9028 TaxID=2871157 RepID=UPI001C977815|nr:DNA/RNA non-specific endonuclease [Cupriavidus sp. AU9028]MBY4898672.1 DNA/RNA non-specific endonuclease [Cupriavidus sp. AU9028]
MRLLLAVSTLAVPLFFTPAPAPAKEAAAPCASVFAHGQAPVVMQERSGTLLCYRAYAILHSGATRTALWSAERLTRGAVEAARTLARDSDFYEENKLPVSERATLADYARSGFDRGHLAPSGDFGDKRSQAESFSLANVIPQHPVSNRRTWSHLETSTRRLVRKFGLAFVVTGPVFDRSSRTLRGRVTVPDFIWKAIYIPGKGAAAYIVRNDATEAYSIISIAELRDFTGIDPFPRLDRVTWAAEFALPPPTPHPGEKAARQVSFSRLVSGAVVQKHDGIKKLAEALHNSGGMLSFASALSR